jgi:DNA repair exonuclease SbcCD ATPase subunit
MVTDDKSEAVAVKVTYNVSEKPLEKAALENLLNTYKSLYDTGASEYTPSTFNAFKTAYDAAKVALATAKTQADLDKAAADLEAAKTALVKQANKTELQTALDQAKLKIENEHTKTTFDALKVAIKNAEDILEDKEATTEKVSQAKSALDSAMNALVKVAASTTINTLNQQLTTVKALDLNLYTPESVTRIQAAITK